MEMRGAAELRRSFEAEALPHLDRLWAAARRLVLQDADAEDLVQETLLRAYRTFRNFTPGTNSRAWLLTIPHSVFVNRRQRARLEPQARPPEELEAEAIRFLVAEDWEVPLIEAASAEAWGLGRTAAAALRSLPETQRAAVLLVDVEGFTYEEAARALDCPIGTVRSRLARARRRLAADLAAYARTLGLSARTGE